MLAVEIFEECADLYARARRTLRQPLVEAAACLWLEPGPGAISLERGAGAGGRRAAGRGRTLPGGPLAVCGLAGAARRDL